MVVIEAGDSHLGNFAADSYTSVGRAHSGIKLGRSRGLGGTTNLWGGQLVEFQPIDFNGRDWMPGSKWPVPYEEIAPYYRPTYLNLGMPAQLIRTTMSGAESRCAASGPWPGFRGVLHPLAGDSELRGDVCEAAADRMRNCPC